MCSGTSIPSPSPSPFFFSLLFCRPVKATLVVLLLPLLLLLLSAPSLHVDVRRVHTRGGGGRKKRRGGMTRLTSQGKGRRGTRVGPAAKQPSIFPPLHSLVRRLRLRLRRSDISNDRSPPPLSCVRCGMKADPPIHRTKGGRGKRKEGRKRQRRGGEREKKKETGRKGERKKKRLAFSFASLSLCLSSFVIRLQRGSLVSFFLFSIPFRP